MGISAINDMLQTLSPKILCKNDAHRPISVSDMAKILLLPSLSLINPAKND